MTNNLDIRCPLFVKIELNKNLVELAFEEWGKEICYGDASDKIINCYWDELNIKMAGKLGMNFHLYDNTSDFYVDLWDEAEMLIHNNRYPFEIKYLDSDGTK